jgi:hypothetical protein
VSHGTGIKTPRVSSEPPSNQVGADGRWGPIAIPLHPPSRQGPTGPRRAHCQAIGDLTGLTSSSSSSSSSATRGARARDGLARCGDRRGIAVGSQWLQILCGGQHLGLARLGRACVRAWMHRWRALVLGPVARLQLPRRGPQAPSSFAPPLCCSLLLLSCQPSPGLLLARCGWLTWLADGECTGPGMSRTLSRTRRRRAHANSAVWSQES